MGKAMIKHIKKEREEMLVNNTALVYAALDADFSSRGDICKATGLKMHQLNTLFINDRDLYAAYTIRRRTLVDMAADNIADIVADKTHPSHFAASKYVLQKYKSDLDTILESQDEKEFEVELGGASTASPVVIRFGKKE